MLTTIFQCYLTVLSAYHIVTGIISFAFPDFAFRFYRKLYGCDPVERRQLTIVMKPWGALAFFAGVCGGFAAVDPIRYVGVVIALWLLLLMRTLYRILYRHELKDVGRIPTRRNVISIAVILIGMVIMGLWIGAFIMGTGSAE